MIYYAPVSLNSEMDSLSRNFVLESFKSEDELKIVNFSNICDIKEDQDNINEQLTFDSKCFKTGDIF